MPPLPPQPKAATVQPSGQPNKPEAAASRPPRGREGGRRDFGREQSPYIEKLISVNRVAKVHKGGKRLSFSTLAVVGDGQGRVGLAMGKANEAAEAIRKGMSRAQRAMVRISLKNGTIPHEVFGQWDASKVLMQPAAPGTGIIAGRVVRAVCEAGGIRDILTKSFGSTNVINLAKATMNGLTSVCSPEEIAQRRKIIVEVA